MFEIGGTLRDARVRRDLSLQQVEADTKIRVKYIQAMENEDFEILPAGTYVKGFLRTYAEYLGLDYLMILDEYNEHFGTGDHKEHVIVNTGKANRDDKPRKPMKQTNFLFVAIFAVAIIAVLAYLGWGNVSSDKPTIISTTETEVVAEPIPAEPPVTEPANTTTAGTSADVLESLVLSADAGNSWIRVRKNNVDGDILWENELNAGESKTFTFTPSDLEDNALVINLGNTLLVEVNGKSQRLESGVYLVTVDSIAELP